ncbi:prepilin-type N-terminal cleavage/methylation domain-containing protein [Curtobacterium sp. MCPF17_046]|uniref:prepilin-type N-terminal cleavage/methylation domain-containing protein n=1 Tax=Curtobacterium sp. MCPF17_046 TaxID=2175663 RepID=UPI000D8C4BEC|nr:prepilin-type N-terminal cleavage/methylation domain-containing protein [Curtobacterium sp. MCPF17_046]PYY41528.1 hypothetical protein DEJ32_04060 [Curtobacterium sp. MCPF17_046]
MSRIHAALTRRLAADSGFTITEVLVAMMVFAVMSIGLAYGITNALLLTQESRSRQTALNLASQDLDKLRSLANPFEIRSTTGDTEQPFTVGQQDYTLSRTTQWVDSAGRSSSCGTDGTTLAYKSITSTVSWKSGRGKPLSVSLDTLIAPSSRINADGTGAILVTIRNAAGTGAAGVPVTITANPGGGGAAVTAPAVTDGSGCTYALKVQPGTYTVSASTPGGIDSSQQEVAKNQNVSVSAGTDAAVTFTYDQAHTFQVAYGTSYPGGTAKLPTNLTTTLYNGVGGSSFFAGTPTTIKAFPYQDGYQVMAGAYVDADGGGTATCLSPNPGKWTTATNGAIGQAPEAVDAAAGVADPPGKRVTVPMGIVTVPIDSGYPYITAVSDSAAPDFDPGCNAPSPKTLTFSGLAAGNATIALPYGTWSLYETKALGSTASSNSKNLVQTASSKITYPNGGGQTNNAGFLVVKWGDTVTLDPRKVP